MLKTGVLVKLLEDIKEGENDVEDERKPVLLQIRGIIPALAEGDLWPDRGFYLKVSDLSHSGYVSLPEEQNEMIFSNRLKLGQFIYVQNLEKSDPVPLLRGLTPVPGRRPCEGTPEDIVPQGTLFRYSDTSDSDSVVEKGVISEKKLMSDSTALFKMNDGDGLDHHHHEQQQQPRGNRKIRSSSASRIRPEGLPSKNRGRSFGYDDSDCESTISSLPISKRKSWNESELLGLKDIYDSSVVKHEIKPTPPTCRRNSRSATASPVRRSVKYDSSDDNSSSTMPKRDTSCSTKKVVRPCSKNKNIWPKSTLEQVLPPVISCINEKKRTETAISWGSFSSSLEKFGKELVMERDAAMNAAVNALQEACAAERMLNSLSVYSDILLEKGNKVEPRVDKFFDLQDDLTQTRLIVQSLMNATPLNTSETCGTSFKKKEEDEALERKKSALTLIKSAIALDLSFPGLPGSKHGTTTMLEEEEEDGAAVVEWIKGSTLSAVLNLEASLQDECRKLFLCYVEKYLEEVEKKTSSSTESSDSELAGMMFKVKKVNDWLEEPEKAAIMGLDDSEVEVYQRVRKKIFSILLNHVQRTAMALETTKTTS